LKLRPVTYLSGAQGSGNDIPHGYIWSPHLVPKPKANLLVGVKILKIYSEKNAICQKKTLCMKWILIWMVK